MCGIAGAVGWIDQNTLNAVTCMSAAMIHRGPDDSGCWRSCDDGHGAAFAFRRLAILDLSPGGHQPMIDPLTGHVLVFNGEIYNYKELRRELEKAGERFHSTGDSEVLLKAYARWGHHVVEKLRGMFAFAIWDASQRVAFLARDRVGIKPLYYATVELKPGIRSVIFASELRSLLACESMERRLNPIGLSTYLWNGFVAGDQTMIDGVRLLPAGTTMTIDSRGVSETPRTYWRLPSSMPQNDGVEELQHELATAMSQHLASDVPLGVFLSGGIDSSAVTALAAQASVREICTFNISFDEQQFDESRYAQSVAQQVGTRHTDIRLTPDTFRARLDEAITSIDQPTFDAINTYFVSRAVREAGITVALAGTGGDELFGGYRSFRDNPRAYRFNRICSRFPQAAVRAMAMSVTRYKSGRFGEVSPQSRWGKLADVLSLRGSPVDLYQISYALFTRDFLAELLNGGIHPATRSGLPIELAGDLDERVGSHLGVAEMSHLEMSCYIGQRLLRDTDAASMATSLEVRVPLLDHRVIEAAAHVEPSRRFFPLGKKQLLRDLALTQLDATTFDRPKSGFVLPIEVWCHQQLRSELEETFSDRTRCESVGLNHDAVQRLWRSFNAGAPGIYWSRVWAIFVLLRWCASHRVTF